MKNLSLADYLILALFSAVCGLAIYSLSLPHNLVDIVELENLRNSFGYRFSDNLDSLTIRSIGDFLLDDPQNEPIKQLIKQLSPKDSLDTPSMAKIISVNGIPWRQIRDPKQRKQLIKMKHNDGHESGRDVLALFFRGTTYQAIVSKQKLTPLDLSIKLIDTISMFAILLLFPALSHGFAYRKLFIFVFCVSCISSMLKSIGVLMVSGDSMIWFAQYEEFIASILIILIYIPVFKILLSYFKYPAWILLIALIAEVILSTAWITAIVFVLSMVVLIAKEKGVNRKFYLEFLYFLLLLIASFVVLGFGPELIPQNIVHTYSEAIKASSTLKVFDSAITILLMLSANLLANMLIGMVFFRIIRLQIKALERFFYGIIIIALTVLLSINAFMLVLGSKDLIDWTLPLTAIGILFFILISRLLLRMIPLFHPVRFSLKDKSVKLLNQSYSFTDPYAYTNFFIGFVKGINRNYRITFYAGKHKSGEVFENLSDERLQETLKLIPQGSNCLNIDLELLNDTPIGKQLKDFDNKLMPHLLLPLYDDEGNVKAVFAFGKMPGIYWHESLATAIAALVSVFRGFYLNMLAQDEIREQSKSLVQEQEAREYNEKLAMMTQEKNALLEEEKKRIMESIEYASLIQKSILPQSSDLNRAFPQNFIIWRPRDIVGGDFYWLFQIPETGELLFAVIDCTGHGVPGALMSVAANAAMDRVVRDSHQYEPAKILSILHQSIGTTLHQESEKTQQDGMDMSLIKFNPITRKLVFSGAKHNLLIHKADTKNLIKIMGNRMSVGGLKWKQAIEFEQQELELASGDTIYLFTDGIIDQPANTDSPKRQRLGSLNWQAYLQSISAQPLFTQIESITAFIDNLLLMEEQRDDICIAAIRV